MTAATTPDPRRQLLGRIGGLRAHALHGPEVMLGGARRGFAARFERQVDPDGVLDPAERAIRADRARRAHMLSLAAKSAESRRRAAASGGRAGDARSATA